MSDTTLEHATPSEQLMSESYENRVQWFCDEFILRHEYFQQAFDSMWEQFMDASPESIHILYGATGSGKTTLIKHFINKLKRECFDNSQWDQLPVVLINAAPKQGHIFKWEPTLERILLELRRPNILPEYRLEPSSNGNPREYTVTESPNPKSYRRAIINGVQNRNIRCLIIDESQHLTQTRPGHPYETAHNEPTIRNRMAFLKDIVKCTQTPIVLTGTLRSRHLLYRSGQLSRLSQTTRFRRYDIRESKEVWKKYKGCIQELLQALPVDETDNLLSAWKTLYKSTYGCIGILADLFEQTLRYCKRKGKDHVKTEHFQRKLPDILKQYHTGVEILEEENNEILEQAEVKELEAEFGVENFDSDELSTPSTTLNPGERAPTDDEVGKEIFDPDYVKENYDL